MSWWYEGEENTDGKPHGNGKYVHATGYTIYKGEFKGGKRDGKGMTYLEDGSLTYDGWWRGGIRHGFGRSITTTDGGKMEEITGIWSRGVFAEKAEVIEDRVFVWRKSLRKKVGKSNVVKSFKVCTEHNLAGDLLFEGQVSSDGYLYEGTGKYYENGRLIYAGSFNQGKRQGSGKQYSQGKIIYEGLFVNGKRDGDGKEYDMEDDSKIIYQGRWKSGKRHGYGVSNNDSGMWIEGEFSDAGELVGKRVYCESKVFTLDGRLLYKGDLKDRKFHGSGKEYVGGKLVYDGEFEEGIRTGEGKLYAKGILVFEGGFENGERTGGGKEYVGVWNSKTRKTEPKLAFEGWFLNGMRNGSGTEYNKDAKKIYTGNFVNGLRHGDGTEFLANGKPSFKGQFAKGKRLGITTGLNKNGKRPRESDAE